MTYPLLRGFTLQRGIRKLARVTSKVQMALRRLSELRTHISPKKVTGYSFPTIWLFLQDPEFYQNQDLNIAAV